MNIWWSPGQSEAAREISRHLTGREKAGLAGLSAVFGLSAFAFVVILMDSITGAGPLQGRLEGFTFPVLVCLAASALAAFPLHRRILLSTQVARDKGYTAADLRARQPLSRGDYLTLGGIAGLAAAIALGTGLIATYSYYKASILPI